MEEDGKVEDFYEEYRSSEEVKIPNMFMSLYNTVLNIFESYGWFLVIGFIVGYYFYNQLKSKLSKFSQQRSEKGPINEDEALKRMERIEAARRRQEAAFEVAKAKYLEEKRLKEERTAQERAEEWELHKQGLGYKNKSKVDGDDKDDLAKLGISSNNALKKKPKLRESDYNPLTGTTSGESCAYRPNRPGPRTGG